MKDSILFCLGAKIESNKSRKLISNKAVVKRIKLFNRRLNHRNKSNRKEIQTQQNHVQN